MNDDAEVVASRLLGWESLAFEDQDWFLTGDGMLMVLWVLQEKGYDVEIKCAPQANAAVTIGGPKTQSRSQDEHWVAESDFLPAAVLAAARKAVER